MVVCVQDYQMMTRSYEYVLKIVCQNDNWTVMATDSNQIFMHMLHTHMN